MEYQHLQPQLTLFLEVQLNTCQALAPSSSYVLPALRQEMQMCPNIHFTVETLPAQLLVFTAVACGCTKVCLLQKLVDDYMGHMSFDWGGQRSAKRDLINNQ